MTKYVQKKSTGTVYRVVHEGENYVFGVVKDRPDRVCYTTRLAKNTCISWEPPFEVGDIVQPRDLHTKLKEEILAIVESREKPHDPWLVLIQNGSHPYVRRRSQRKLVSNTPE